MSTHSAPSNQQKNKDTISIALAGNPNSGKTTLFNALTGLRQHVGNYAGVTVEKKEGRFSHNGHIINVLDLPGTYSLTASSPEELAARNAIIEEKPDLVVDVLDASNLERNLYLAIQFMELRVPMILVLNMSDVAESRGTSIDLEKLASLLNVKIVKTVGHKSSGLEDLKETIVQAASDLQDLAPTRVTHGRHVEDELSKLTQAFEDRRDDNLCAPSRWLALKLLEDDKVVSKYVNNEVKQGDKIVQIAASSRIHLANELGDDAEVLIADSRYGFISGACQESVRSTVESRHTMSDRIDMVMTNRALGIPIFLFLMFLVFKLTFTVGDPLMGWIESFFGWAGGAISASWPEGSAPLVKSLIVDGIIGGVGGVIVFLPNILLLFLAIAILEDSGYMARAAFIMDRFMQKLGLHGKSFIPMLVGFGCTVPAIMATRTLENKRDRMTTMLVAPLMSCGARLPIYVLIIPAFFPEHLHAPMLWLIYVIGIALAIIVAKLLRTTLFAGETEPFVMELPPYRMPTPKGVLAHMWERGWLYLKKAGTIILGISIVMWALITFPEQSQPSQDYTKAIKNVKQKQDLTEEQVKDRVTELQNQQQSEALQHTIAGRIGHALEPVIKPLGFDWRIGTALIGAFAAKEVFVAQMGIVYAVGEADASHDGLRDKLTNNYAPLQGFCIMLFCLISAPCMATIAVTRRESNSWKWALFQLGGLTVLAYIITLAVYQIGNTAGIGT